jgi:hypothetical protein
VLRYIRFSTARIASRRQVISCLRTDHRGRTTLKSRILVERRSGNKESKAEIVRLPLT